MRKCKKAKFLKRYAPKHTLGMVLEEFEVEVKDFECIACTKKINYSRALQDTIPYIKILKITIAIIV